jgi:2,5-diamino-6-(ribosylamino)-4(3H)-pyrimidinone 5'-phosphate reductase
MHEGIMVGVGTAINDDPRLNGKSRTRNKHNGSSSNVKPTPVRLLPQSYHSQTPQPIVLDPKLRLPPTARMLQALKDKHSPHAKTPWLLCQKIQDWDQDIKQRKALLEEAGAKIVEVDMVEGQHDLMPSMTDDGLIHLFSLRK